MIEDCYNFDLFTETGRDPASAWRPLDEDLSEAQGDRSPPLAMSSPEATQFYSSLSDWLLSTKDRSELLERVYTSGRDEHETYTNRGVPTDAENLLVSDSIPMAHYFTRTSMGYGIVDDAVPTVFRGLPIEKLSTLPYDYDERFSLALEGLDRAAHMLARGSTELAWSTLAMGAMYGEVTLGREVSFTGNLEIPNLQEVRFRRLQAATAQLGKDGIVNPTLKQVVESVEASHGLDAVRGAEFLHRWEQFPLSILSGHVSSDPTAIDSFFDPEDEALPEWHETVWDGSRADQIYPSLRPVEGVTEFLDQLPVILNTKPLASFFEDEEPIFTDKNQEVMRLMMDPYDPLSQVAVSRRYGASDGFASAHRGRFLAKFNDLLVDNEYGDVVREAWGDEYDGPSPEPVLSIHPGVRARVDSLFDARNFQSGIYSSDGLHKNDIQQ